MCFATIAPPNGRIDKKPKNVPRAVPHTLSTNCARIALSRMVTGVSGLRRLVHKYWGLVRAGNRRLSEQAIANIYGECRELGVDVGLDPKRFVDAQIELSRAISAAQLPSEA